MTSLNSLFSIARDGLQAQSAGVTVTGQNITNVNTPGYVRRGVLMQPRQYGGVNVTGVSRSFQRTSHGRLVEEHGRHGAAQVRASALAAVESIVAPGVPTIGDRVNSFFQSLDTLSGAPADRTARLDVLQRTTALAQQISGTAADLSLQRSDLFSQATGITTEVNDRLTRIASLNLAIARATGEGDAATDLRDTRDQLVLEVGDRLGARAVEDANGQVTLFAAGTALVEGGHASTLSVSLDAANNLLFQVQQTGGASTNVTSFVTQGSLGGLREVRDTDIVQVQTNLDQFAFDLATAVNGVHSAGFGLDGVTGRPLFTTTATAVGAARALTVNAAVAGQPDRLAAATLASDLPGGNGTAHSTEPSEDCTTENWSARPTNTYARLLCAAAPTPTTPIARDPAVGVDALATSSVTDSSSATACGPRPRAPPARPGPLPLAMGHSTATGHGAVAPGAHTHPTGHACAHTDAPVAAS